MLYFSDRPSRRQRPTESCIFQNGKRVLYVQSEESVKPLLRRVRLLIPVSDPPGKSPSDFTNLCTRMKHLFLTVLPFLLLVTATCSNRPVETIVIERATAPPTDMSDNPSATQSTPHPPSPDLDETHQHDNLPSPQTQKT